jgi:REP element-mobilizing transposase RayT
VPSYRRNFLPGGSFFFTVNLAERRSRLLVDNVELLRAVFRDVRRRHPFAIGAIAVLPDHLHAIWTLPEGDTDFSIRWSLVKRGSAAASQEERKSRPVARANANAAFGSADIGSTRSVTRTISPAMSITSIFIRLNMAMSVPSSATGTVNDGLHTLRPSYTCCGHAGNDGLRNAQPILVS